MKRLVVIVVAALAAGVLSCALYFHHRRAAAEPVDEMSWLKKEFALDERQFVEIERLHRAYRTVCDAHCADYMTAHQRFTALLERSPSFTTETEHAMDSIHRIQMECQGDMLKHAYEVARLMSPAQGNRYLTMIKARVLATDPDEMRRNTR